MSGTEYSIDSQERPMFCANRIAKLVEIAGLLISAMTCSSAQTQNYVAKFNGSGGTTNSSIFDNGNVGIGTTSPTAPLTVVGDMLISNAWDNKLISQQNSKSFDLIGTYYGWTPTAVYIGGYNSTNNSSVSQVTKVVVGGAGSTLPLEVTGTINVDGATASTFAGNVGIGTISPSAKLEVNGRVKLTSGSGGTVTFADGTTQSTAWTGALCGGDYAESIDVSDNRTLYQPGDVLIIDDDHPGNFLKSVQPYSPAVAGIYSTKPGLVGRRQKNPKTGEEIPMAMIGIVPVKVSAENGPIRLHDLLVSSSTPGYAMKGTDRDRMLGAVIGKALGSLNSGIGTIEVLVTLQ